MALNTKVAINVEIKNIKKVADLKKELQGLRKEQKSAEKQAKTGQFTSKKAEKQYIANAKAIKDKSKSLRDLNKNLNGTTKATKRATKSNNSLSKSFIKAAAALAIVVGAFRLVSRALSSVVSTFTEFEFVMAKVRAVSGATDNEFAKLTASAEDLGRKTFFTATQVGELQLAFSKLGFTSAEILAATKATLDLATSTGTDLARAAQVAGASIRGFQLDASEAGRVVDVMAVAFASSALDIEKWNTSMTKVAPIAAMAGFEIEEVAAIMGKLTDTGIEASIAGTSLRNIFLKMQDPTSDLSKTIGHTITNLDEMLIAFKGLQEEGTDLTDVLSFMDVRQVAAFGTMLEGSDDIETLRNKLLEARGEGERMADMVGDTLQGAFLKFKSAIEGVAIVVMKNFGDGMKKSIVGLSKFLNSIVKNEDAIAELADKVKTAAKWIANIIKVLASYVVGAKLVALWTATTSSAFFTMMTASQRAATAVRLLAVAMRTLKVALVSTGIGALVIVLGELLASTLSSSDALDKAADAAERIQGTMAETKKEVTALDLAFEKLTKNKKKQLKIDREIAKEGKDLAVHQEKKNRLITEQTSLLRIINPVAKTYNTALLDEKSTLEDINKAYNDIIPNLKNNMIAKAFHSLSQETLNFAAGASIVKEKMEKEWGKGMLAQIILAYTEGAADPGMLQEAARLFDGRIGEYMLHTDKWPGAFKRSDVQMAKDLALALEQTDMTLGEFQAAIKDGYYDNEMALIQKTLSAQMEGGIDLGDLLNQMDTGGKDKPEKKDAIFAMNEKIAKHTEAFNLKGIQDEKEYQKGLLAAQIAGVQEYLDQYAGKESKNKAQVTAGNLRMADLLRKQRKANESEELTALRTQATESLTIAKQNFTNKLSTAFQYAIEVNQINQQLLKDEFDLLSESEKLGKKGSDIKAKQATLDLNLRKTTMDESERLLKNAHNDAVKALELEQSTTMMSQMEFDNRMLQLEADFLGKKADLHAGNALVLIDINNDILANNVEVNKKQKQMMEEQVSAMGGVGSALTSLAGDNEKLNFIKEAGNKISQVANIISAVTTLRADLETLSTIKKNTAKIIGNTTEEASILLDKQKIVTTNIKTGAENLNTGANITNTVSEGANTAATLTGTIATTLSLIPKAISSILTSAMALPFPINLVAIVATMALVRKVMKFEEGGIIGNKYANGGMVHGKSHAQGGEKFAVGGRVVELEGGEAVINKRSTAKYKSQLSAMNADGGGVKFADGGLLNSPAFAQQQFSATMSGGSMAQKVYVVEADISKTQQSVNVLEAAATL